MVVPADCNSALGSTMVRMDVRPLGATSTAVNGRERAGGGIAPESVACPRSSASRRARGPKRIIEVTCSGKVAAERDTDISSANGGTRVADGCGREPVPAEQIASSLRCH
ncbi:Carbamate kinase [Rhodococcus sp. AW25M09]|nr:Carbamate kinase [Rhodococcus sp. AW25M09]